MDLDLLDLASLRRRKGEKWGTYPTDVLPAWVADMDFPVCAPIRRLLEQGIADGDLGYPSDAALVELVEAFVGRAHERFSWGVDPRRVEALTDVVQGLYIGLLTYSERGDGAIVQSPVYPPFLHAVPECDRRILINQLRPCARGYEIDFDNLRSRIEPRTRLLLFCNPQNPTGRAFTRPELESLAELVLDHDLIVLSDEIHADLVFPGAQHIPLATISPEVADRTVTLMSASKAFNIAGLRCAVAVFGSAELQARFNTLAPHLRGGLGCLGLAATTLAWRDGQSWLAEVVDYLDGNRRLVSKFVTDHMPRVRHRAPEATYLAWLDCRDLALPTSPQQFFLERGKVALSNGAAFGPGGEGFVRLNFATSRPILSEILDRMHSALSE